jgi:TetR/AcrR family transcriptional regulator of autoinduction and epiphytic fitness
MPGDLPSPRPSSDTGRYVPFVGASEPDGQVTDRRVLRGKRNREAVVQAVIDLMQEGNLSPSADQIAERAGVARRSIYHHFADLEELHQAVAHQHLDHIVGLFGPIVRDGSLQDRLRTFVDQRVRVCEQTMPVYRASQLVAHHSETVMDLLSLGHEYLRAEVAQTFAPEIGDDAWRLEAVDSAASFEGWVQLRVVRALDVDRATQVLRRSLHALLTAEVD